VFLVLGATEVRKPDGPARLRPRETALLTALLLHPREHVHADALAAVIWEDQPRFPRGAVANLVSRTRSALAREFYHVLPRGSGGYTAVPPPGSLDLDWFRLHAQNADRAQAKGDLPGAARSLGHALGCWRLPPGCPRLPGLPCTPAADSLTSGLLEERTQCLLRWADLLIRLGRQGEALPDLTAASIAQPACEPVAALLVTALALERLTGPAFEAYARTQDALAAKSGAPGAELRQACAQAGFSPDAPRPGALRPGTGQGHGK